MSNDELLNRSEIYDPPKVRTAQMGDSVCQLAYAICKVGQIDGFSTLPENAVFHARKYGGKTVECVLVDRFTFEAIVKRAKLTNK